MERRATRGVWLAVWAACGGASGCGGAFTGMDAPEGADDDGTPADDDAGADDDSGAADDDTSPPADDDSTPPADDDTAPPADDDTAPDTGVPDAVEAVMEVVLQPFDGDPGWEGLNNRSPAECLEVVQAFGYSPTAWADGEPGEVGGRVSRSITPAWYGYPFGPEGWDGRLAFDGRISLVHGNGEAYVGFFSSEVQGFRPANFLGLRLEGETTYAELEVSYTTGSFRSGGDKAEFVLPADGEGRHFVVEYLPDGGDGFGSVSVTLDGETYTWPFPEGVQDEPLAVDRMGIMNVQKPGAQTMELYLDGLYFNVDNSSHPFDADPGWDGEGHLVTFTDCEQRGVQDFGFSATAYAGGAAAGEVGGLIWRSSADVDPPILYADATVAVDASMPLYAAGRVSAERAAVDSGVMIGWFRYADDFDDTERPPNFLGIGVEGPSAVGHYFNAMLTDEAGERYREDAGPVILPDGGDLPFSVHYDPDGAGGLGTVEVRLGDEVQVMTVPAEFRDGVQPFNRFGLTPWRPDGQSLEVFLDDLVYTPRPL